ncbi:unnamed protein product [Prorocentrum cordatum]|uniref:Uncharacterized protein n=1 Tax=Prorocentrum cordatum TaxID=2364126 RepID=A0ABN9SU34_9DINO|nr:unnamed protein product [Polarella glacialis]CAK0836003.1 unnamed protein product [Polarella glacialis]
MWPCVVAVAVGIWLWRGGGGERDGHWHWSAEEGAWIWRWGSSWWIYLEELPWVHYADEANRWPGEDGAGAPGMWWSFTTGLPSCHIGGSVRTDPRAADPAHWRHWAGPNPHQEMARYRQQDAARASTWRATARLAAARLPRPAESLVLELLGAPAACC